MRMGDYEYARRLFLLTSVFGMFFIMGLSFLLAEDDGNTLQPDRWLQRYDLPKDAVSSDVALTTEFRLLDRSLFLAADVAFTVLRTQHGAASQKTESHEDVDLLRIHLQRLREKIETLRKLVKQQQTPNPYYTQIITCLDGWLIDQQVLDADGEKLSKIPTPISPDTLCWRIIAAYAHFAILYHQQSGDFASPK